MKQLKQSIKMYEVITRNITTGKKRTDYQLIIDDVIIHFKSFDAAVNYAIEYNYLINQIVEIDEVE